MIHSRRNNDLQLVALCLVAKNEAVSTLKSLRRFLLDGTAPIVPWLSSRRTTEPCRKTRHGALDRNI